MDVEPIHLVRHRDLFSLDSEEQMQPGIRVCHFHQNIRSFAQLLQNNGTVCQLISDQYDGLSLNCHVEIHGKEMSTDTVSEWPFLVL